LQATVGASEEYEDFDESDEEFINTKVEGNDGFAAAGVP
jgi:hypothetical protein